MADCDEQIVTNQLQFAHIADSARADFGLRQVNGGIQIS
jgi:hypothetical protein